MTDIEQFLQSLQGGAPDDSGVVPSPGYQAAGAGMQSSLLSLVAPGLNPAQSVSQNAQNGAQNSSLMMKAFSNGEGAAATSAALGGLGSTGGILGFD